MTIKPNQTNQEHSLCADCDNKQATVSLLPLNQVLEQIPISRSAWLSGVRRGLYPPPVRLSTRRVAWKSTDIDALIFRFSSQQPNFQFAEQKANVKISSKCTQSSRARS